MSTKDEIEFQNASLINALASRPFNPDYTNPIVTTSGNWSIGCINDGCPTCGGSGKDGMGRPCVHMISCPCPKCSPQCVVP